MAIIVPAILEYTPGDFMDKMSRVIKLPGIQRIQVDFGDGIFVSSKILPIEQIDTLNPAFHFEAHLMIKSPQDFLDYQICGFKTIILHSEAYENAKDLRVALQKIKALGLKRGIAINPGTPVSVLQGFETEADQFLVMSVIPGRQGQAFMLEALEKVKELRQRLPRAIIEVDGGVNVKNIKSLEAAGCDLICVGSALTKAADLLRAYQQLQREINTKYHEI